MVILGILTIALAFAVLVLSRALCACKKEKAWLNQWIEVLQWKPVDPGKVNREKANADRAWIINKDQSREIDPEEF